MSQENVEIVRRHHEAFLSGDREGALEPLDPEVEFVFPALFDFPGARGHAELEKAMRQWMGTWVPGTYRFEPKEYDDLGDKVLVRYIEHGFGRTSGVEVTREAFQLWDMDNGKAVRLQVFEDRREALEAGGLRE